MIFTVEQLGKSDIWEEEGQYTVHMSDNLTSFSLHLDLHFYGFFFSLFFLGLLGREGDSLVPETLFPSGSQPY